MNIRNYLAGLISQIFLLNFFFLERFLHVVDGVFLLGNTYIDQIITINWGTE